MLAKDPLYDRAQMGAHILALGPVDGHVLPHGLDEFAGDRAKRLVSKDLNGAVVDATRCELCGSR